MGFEQLAALRDQLAAEAAKKRQSERNAASGKDKAARRPPADRSGKDTESSSVRAEKRSGPDNGRAPEARDGQRAGARTSRSSAGRNNARTPGQDRAKTERKPRQESSVEPVVINISRLQRLYPKAFPKRPDPKVPLKLGIHKDLYAQAETIGLSQEDIKEAIKTWCQGNRYWSCLVLDAPRVDLAGEPAGVVTESEAKRARQLASRQRWQARNALKKANTEAGVDTAAEVKAEIQTLTAVGTQAEDVAETEIPTAIITSDNIQIETEGTAEGEADAKSAADFQASFTEKSLTDKKSTEA